jgi:hypothetical protein
MEAQMNRQRQFQAFEQGSARRGKPNHRLSDVDAFIPSSSEIEEACEQIRTGWNQRQHRVRAGLSPDEGIVLEPVSLAGVHWNCIGPNED